MTLTPARQANSSSKPKTHASSSHKGSPAAKRIQRAYRRFRAQFPDQGRLHSRSSSSPVIYQDDERIAPTLSRRFAAALIRMARLRPDERDDEIAAALSSGALRVAPGMIRAALDPATGKVAFSGGSASAWAVRGYRDALEKAPAVADLTGRQINYALIKVQLEDAPELAAKVANKEAKARLMRTVARRKSRSPKHGGKVREVVAEVRPTDVVVGSPGDTFGMPRDLRKFMGHALGGFSRYRWQMNPRRRRRIALPAGFRVKRWIMHSNLGVSARTLYAWLREMYAWRDRVDARRNWAALYPRPLVTGDRHAQSLASSLRDLLRRHVFGLAPAARPMATSSLSAYSRAASGASLTSSVGPFFGASRTQPRRPYARNLRVAGIMGDGQHAGVFVLYARRYEAGWQLQMAILDPIGAITFPVQVRATMEAALREAVKELGIGPGGASVARLGAPVVDVQVGLVPVPRKLAVQYASEGSCGPSSIALLMSLLRVIKKLPANASPMEAIVRAFRGVKDEDVVLAVQLHHNGVL